MEFKSNFAEYTIHGVKVKFPYKPYPSQLTMMDKIIKSIERRQNSLLESPTGSGKSLALLCSSLAWLMAEKERIHQKKLEFKRSLAQKNLDESNESTENCVKNEQKPDVKVKVEQLNGENDVKPAIKMESNADIQIKQDPNAGIDQKPVKAELDEAINNAVKIEKTDQSLDEKSDLKSDGGGDATGDDKTKTAESTGMNHDDCSATEESALSQDDEDFQAPKKRFRTPGGQIPRAKRPRNSELEQDHHIDPATMSAHPEWSMKLNNDDNYSSSNKTCGSDTCNDDDEAYSEMELADDLLQEELPIPPSPKIYFGTRTHKQITQIVRELNKTEYSKTKMCILASREHTCIHPYVSKAKNKNEECRKSVENKEGKSCAYHSRARYVRTQADLEDYGINKAWNISELVELGEKIQGCPYYMTHEIMKDADVIFCPYNYLIDPVIRRQMNIGLEHQIVIVDEAHNIEDSSRDSASWSVTPQSLEEAMIDLDYLVSKNIHREQHQVFHEVCATLRRWIVTKAESPSGCHDYVKRSKIWEGQELKKVLDHLGFIPTAVHQLVKHLIKVFKPQDSSRVRDKMERQYMHAPTATLFERLLMVLTFMIKDDYKYLCDFRVAITKDYAMVPVVMPNGFRRKGEYERKLVHTLNFWCLSPAVAFSEISEDSRSVILTSGTLSPMSTFSSELGCKFPIHLEANHVVGSSQVFVRSLSTGPTGSVLNATYRFSETFNFQDEIGEAIHKVCEVIPHGVLCFLPSYALLDKLMKRWKMTGLWGRLSRLKDVFSEPRGGDKSDFNGLLNDFYYSIKLSEESDSPSDDTTGALFFAVCRGKVSEGLDFADNNARAVITVGIPFPNVKDIQVELKRKYNDQNCSLKGLLNGNEWYEIQAFRALNQALGRCIRHRNDWGAILLIDERFGRYPKYRTGLSKWIRNKVVHHNNFPDLLSSLKTFTKERQENPCLNSSSMLQSPFTTPERSKDSGNIPSSQESPISVKSGSQPTPNTIMDIASVKQEPSLLTTSTPGNPQTTPELKTGNVTSFVSSTPVADRAVRPRILHLSPLVRPQAAGTVDSPQRIMNPQCVVNFQNPPGVNRMQVNNNQNINNPQQVINLQQLNLFQQQNAGNRPVLLRFVSTSGQPVRHALLTGQRLQFVVPQTSAKNVDISNMVGQQGMPRTGLVQLRGVGERIRLNMNGQPGGQNSGLNTLVQLQTRSTTGANGDLGGSVSTTDVQRGHGGLPATAGIVKIKQEPQSPPDTQREHKEKNSTPTVKQGFQLNQRDALGKQNNFDTSLGVKQDSSGIQEGISGTINKVQRRPLFSASTSCETVDAEKTENKETGESALNVNVSHNEGSSLINSRNNIPKPLDFGGGEVNEPMGESMEGCDDPESPLLFSTPPTSFENDNVTKGGVEVDRVKIGQKGITGDNNVQTMDCAVENGGQVDMEKCKPHVDTIMDRKVHQSHVKTTMDNNGSGRMDRCKDILDIVNDTVRNKNSNMPSWNVKCKACHSILYSDVNSFSDQCRPKEEVITTDTMLGNILNSLFSLKTNKKKKYLSLTTFFASDVNILQGCCPALPCDEEKQNRQDVKLNSIYCEKKSVCYIPLVCKQCQEARSIRGRISIVAVQAVPCGTGDSMSKLMAWFSSDKAELLPTE